MTRASSLLEKLPKPTVFAVAISCAIIVIINVMANSTILQGWNIHEGQYTLIFITEGKVNNVTVTTRLYSFNSSDAVLKQTTEGIQAKTLRNGEIEIHVWKLENATKATITLEHIKPIESISLDSYRIYSEKYPELKGELDNCTLVFSHFAVYADSPLAKLQVYSNSITGRIIGNEMVWESEESKTKTLTVTRLGIGLLSFAIAMSLLWASTTLRVPKVTPLIAAGLVFVYVYLGVGNDFLANFELNTFSQFALTLLSPFFHGDYGHLMGNIFGFLICGSLIEIWWKGISRKALFLWYISPLPFSIALSGLSIAKSLLPPIGASLWVVGLAIANTNYAFDNKHRIDLRTSKRDFAAMLLSGYVIMRSSYDYITYLLSYHFLERVPQTVFGHLAFFIIYFAFLAASKAIRRWWALRRRN